MKNIAEILKNCPKGTKLYSPLYGGVKLEGIRVTKYYTLIDVINSDGKIETFYDDGRYYDEFPESECLLFPSKDNRDWDNFQRPFQDGDIIYNPNIKAISILKSNTLEESISYVFLNISGNLRVYHYHSSDLSDWRFATEEEKQKLFDAIKDNGSKWNAETKTLEKLVEPKFKVGDTITNGKATIKIGHIDKEYYYEIGENIANMLCIKCQDEWKLVKFDISTLKPFDKVLVRCNSLEQWHIQFFEKYNRELGAKYPFICLCDSKYCQCIPFEGNEHLVGTYNNCDEYYKTW